MKIIVLSDSPRLSSLSYSTVYLVLSLRYFLQWVFYAIVLFATPIFANIAYLGDDYTDSGNYPTTPWTGGTAIWSTFFGDDFGKTILPSSKGGTNFAWALALTGTTSLGGSVPMLDQLTNLLQSPKDLTAPVLIFGGANDLIYQLTVPYSQNQSVQNLIFMMQSLKRVKFNTIFSLNVFDVGLLPQGAGVHPPQSQLAQQTVAFNTALADKIGSLAFEVIAVDVYSLLNSIVANPGLYGFINVTNPAPTPIDFQGYLYWFPIGEAQPFTLQFHQILADYVYSFINAALFYSMLADQPQTILRGINANLRQQLFPTQEKHELQRLYFFTSGDYVPMSRPPMANEHSFRSQGGDLMVGVTERITEKWTVGGSVGLVLNSSHNKKLKGSCYFSTQSEIVSFLTNYTSGWGYINGIVDVGCFQFKNIERKFRTGPLDQRAYGDTLGVGFGTAWEGTYFVVDCPSSFQTGPRANLEYQGVVVNGYSEHGAFAGNLTFKGQMSNSFISGLGWEMRLRRKYSPFTLVSDLSLSMNRQWLNGAREIHLQENTLPQSFGAWPILGNGAWFGTANATFSGTFPNGSALSFGYVLNYGEHNMSESFLTVGFSLPFPK